MDIVLKRRLIGASILIALAVIFVPMLLVAPDSVDDGMGDSVDVPPMPESAGDVRRIPLDPEAARVADASGARERSLPPPMEAADSSDAPDDGSDNPVPERQVESQRPPDHEIVLRPELARPDPDSDPVAAADAESGEVARATPNPPEDEPPVEPEIDESADPAVDSEPAAADSDDISLGDFVVQVASFGSAESANRVRDRLEALGHIVNRDEIVRGDTLLYRLRTGPYPSRSAAERALEQIRATVTGVNPIVRALDDESLAGGASGFAVQIGSFVGQDNAESETARLAELGFDSRRFSEQVGERLIWRVIVGPVADRAEAEALKRRVAEDAGVEGLVVSIP